MLTRLKAKKTPKPPVMNTFPVDIPLLPQISIFSPDPPIETDQEDENPLEVNPGEVQDSSSATFPIIAPQEEERVPTYFSSAHGNTQTSDEISTDPHTLTHTFVEYYVDGHMWTDLFDEHVQPFDPQVVKGILSSESMLASADQAQYIEDYTRFYLQLSTWRNDGTLNKIDLEDIASGTPQYKNVRDCMISILAMHPYVSTGWTRVGANGIEKRVPTFFSYVHGKIQKNDEISTEPQGPHTVAHKFVQDYVDSHMWTDLFDEQVQPFNPQVVNDILCSESMTSFHNQARYMEDYTRFYLQLTVWRHDGTLNKIDLEDIASGTPQYAKVHHYMICIIEMHPYGSYGWDRGDADCITPQEIAGKGEHAISMARYEQQLDTIVDVHGRFKNQAAYLSFLGIRIPPRKSPSTESEVDPDTPIPPLDFALILGRRTTVVSDEAQVLMGNLNHWLQSLSNNYKSLVLSLAPYLPIEKADDFFWDIRNASSESYRLVKDIVSNLLLLRAFHSGAFSMAPWKTLQDLVADTLSQFSVHPYPLPSNEGLFPSDIKIRQEIMQRLLHYAPFAQQSEAIEVQDTLPPITGSGEPESSKDSGATDSPATFDQPLSLHTLLKAMELASSFDVNKHGTNQMYLLAMDTLHMSEKEMYDPNDPNGILKARDILGLNNAVTVAGPGGAIYVTLEGQLPIIYLICLNGSCAVSNASILGTPWLTSFAPTEQTEQVTDLGANQSEAAPPSPEPPLSEVFTANNCLIIAIYQANLRAEQAMSPEDIQAARPTTKEMLEIRRRINAPPQSFLDADSATIRAIRQVFDITNSISFWHCGTLLAFFNGSGELPGLPIYFSHAHFTAMDPTVDPASVTHMQDDESSQASIPDAVQNRMGDSLIRAIALAGQRYAGTGIIDLLARHMKDIRRMRGCLESTPLPCDARTISHIRSVLGIDNPIAILAGSAIKNFYPGLVQRSAILLWDLDGYYMEADPAHVPDDLLNTICGYPPEMASPDNLVKSILDLFDINNSNDVMYIESKVKELCHKRISDFLEINARSIHAIQKVLDQKFNLVLIRDKAKSSEFVWAEDADVLILSDVGDHYEPLKRLTYAQVFGELPVAHVNPSFKQHVSEQEDEAVDKDEEEEEEEDVLKENALVSDPLLAAIAQAYKKKPGIHVPNALAKAVYLGCKTPFQLDLLPTLETLEIIQQVLEIPNPIKLIFESKSQLFCNGQEDEEPIVLLENGDTWIVPQENPIHKVPPLEAIQFAVDFLTLPVDFDPQYFPNLPAILSELKANQMRLKFLILYPQAARDPWEQDLLMCTQLVSNETQALHEEEGLNRLQGWLLFEEYFSRLLQRVEYTSSFNWLRDLSEEDLPKLSQHANLNIYLQSYHLTMEDNHVGLFPCGNECEWTSENPSHSLQIMRIFGASGMIHYCCPGGKTEMKGSLPSTISVLIGAELDRFNIENPFFSLEEDAEVFLSPPVVEIAAFARLWDNLMRFAAPAANAYCDVQAEILSTQDSFIAGVHLVLYQAPPSLQCTIQLGDLGAVHVELEEVGFHEPIPGDASPLRHLDPVTRRAILSGNTGILCSTIDQSNRYFLRINFDKAE